MNVLVITDQDINISDISSKLGIDVGHNNVAESNVAVYDCAADTKLPSGWANVVLLYGSCKYATEFNVSESLLPSLEMAGLADVIAEYLEEETPVDSD